MRNGKYMNYRMLADLGQVPKQQIDAKTKS